MYKEEQLMTIRISPVMGKEYKPQDLTCYFNDVLIAWK